MNGRRKASMIWLIRSVCPSVCGWKDVDILGLIPKRARKTCQVEEVNLESRSETMSLGKPCNLHTSRAKILARSSAFFPSGANGMKCAILVNRSMTTQSSLHPEDRGRSVMKSMAMDSHGA